MTSATIERQTGLKGDYLASWDSFVGQDQIKRMLKIAAKSAKLRDDRLPHLFFSGEGGLGKTTLALLCGLEMQKRVLVISGSVDVNQFRILVSDLSDGDVILWDEFHLAVVGGKNKVEFLLNVLQDGVIAGPMGAEEMPNVTIIACTTEAGRLPQTILGRFRQVGLIPYSDDDAVTIAEGWADRLMEGLPQPSGDNFIQMARAGSNNPRIMQRIMEMLRDIALAEECDNYDMPSGEYDVAEALEMLGLTADGLTLTAQRYMVALLKDFAGGAGAKALEDRLNEPGGLAHVEKSLTDKGFIAKTKGGRVLTQVGLSRARALAV